MVRIMTYCTLENIIDGVVITFMDITVSKMLEAELRKTQTGLKKHIVEQDIKLDQVGEKLQAEMKRGQSKKGAGTITGSEETKETTP
jgi:two-component system CheB/CheR fusion protein